MYKIEKFDPHKVWTLALFDSSLGYPYLKRFVFEPTAKPQRFVGTEAASKLLLLTDTVYPRLEVTFGGADEVRPPLEIDAEDFISVKGFKAKGKRISTFIFKSITELEPTRFPEPAEEKSAAEIEEVDPEDDSSDRQGPIVVQGDLFAIDEDSTNP